MATRKPIINSQPRRGGVMTVPIARTDLRLYFPGNTHGYVLVDGATWSSKPCPDESHLLRLDQVHACHSDS